MVLLEILHDEISTLQLELGQIDERNQLLQKDNAKLLQRWLDAKQVEANKMNEANEFYETMRSQQHSVINWRNGASGDASGTSERAQNGGPESVQPAPTPMSGKGLDKEDGRTTKMKDQLPSPSNKTVDLTPNG